jgi:hypothetical protein
MAKTSFATLRASASVRADLALMALNADLGFTYDARGRMLQTNEPLPSARRPAPRLFLGRTLAGHVARFGAGLPDTAVAELEAVLGREPTPTELESEPIAIGRIRRALATVQEDQSGPAFRFPPGFAAAMQAPITRITAANCQLARDTFPWLFDEADDWQPTFAVVRDGAVVSVCFSSRVTAAACAAGVETLPDFRGRGYAAAATAAWGEAVLASGRVPFYGTSWDNQASRGVARRLGLVMFGTDNSWS